MPPEDSNYPDATDQTTASKDSPTPDTEGDKVEGETALLPKSLFAGKDLTVGSECKVKIEHVFGDEVEVSYVPHDDEESGETKPDNESMEGAMAKMDAMGTESE